MKRLIALSSVLLALVAAATLAGPIACSSGPDVEPADMVIYNG